MARLLSQPVLAREHLQSIPLRNAFLLAKGRAALPPFPQPRASSSVTDAPQVFGVSLSPVPGDPPRFVSLGHT